MAPATPALTTNEHGETDFVTLLLHCTRLLDIPKEPYYKIVEFHKPDTIGCAITVYIEASKKHPGFAVTTPGHDPNLTKHTAALNTIRRLCNIYEKEIEHTSIRFFPAEDRTTPLWKRRLTPVVEARVSNKNPTMSSLTNYLYALDTHFQKLDKQLFKTHRRVLASEMEARKLRVQNASLRARLAATEDKERAAWEMVRSTRTKYKEKMERMAKRTRTEPEEPAKQRKEHPVKRTRTEPEEPAEEERTTKKARTEPEEPAQNKEAEERQDANLASLELDWSLFPPASEAFSNDDADIVIDLSAFEMLPREGTPTPLEELLDLLE